MNKKTGIILAAAAVVVIVIVCIFVLIFGNTKEEYRSVQVQKTEGTIAVVNDKETLEAYDGMKLGSGDSVEVKAESSLILKLDEDKYVYADENTRFQIEASGDEKSGKVVINLSEGSVLVAVQKALSDEAAFEVHTPNGIMSIRGTVFSVATQMDAAGNTTTEVSVFEGEVSSLGTGNSEATVVTPGNQLTLTGNENPAETMESIQLEELSDNILNWLLEISENMDLYVSKEEILAILNQAAVTPAATPTPVPTATPTPTPVQTVTPVPTVAPTNTPIPTPTPMVEIDYPGRDEGLYGKDDELYGKDDGYGKE